MTKVMRLSAILATVLLAATGCAKQGAAVGGTEDNWPAGQTMTMLVGYAAGGTTDVMARALALELEKKLDVQIQVVNEDGAGGQREYTSLAGAKPDGLTLGTLNYPTIITTMIDKSKKATYTLDNFQPLANHVNDPRVTIVQPDSDFKTAADLVKYAKANPLKLTGATSGLSGGGHFSMLKLEDVTGANFAPVHFNKGQADAKAAFLGGHVDVYFASIGDGLELIKSGEGRAVGVAAAKRSTLLPDVPTFLEQGIEVEESGMRGYALPAGVSKEHVAILAKALEEIITSPAHQEKLKKLALQAEFMGPVDYTAWLKAQMPIVERVNELSKSDE